MTVDAVARPAEAATGSAAIRVSVLRGREPFRALQDEWTELLLDSAQPSAFLSWEWMDAWLRTWAPGGHPHVLVARQSPDGRLVGLAPLHATGPRLLGPGTMRPMGTGVGADHLGFVMRRGAEADAGRALAAAMVSSDGWDVLDLPRLDGATAQFLLQAASAVPAGRLAWTSRVADQCPYISLPQTWEAYLGALSSNARKDLGRRWRRLRERGRVTIERLTEPPDLERGWDALLRLHRDRRERAGGRSAFTTGRVGAFHEAFLRAAAERGWVRLYLMRVDGHEVAAEYCLKVGPRVSDLQTGSDGGWAHYGVGTLIVAHAIQEAIAEGAREYDLLRGGESYKQQRWGASIREDVSLLVWRRRPRARLFMAARAWEVAAKSYLRRRLRGRRGRG